MDDCPLDAPQPSGKCHWCGKKLAGRQRRWCSRTCARTAVKEHRWTQARQAKRAEAAWYECAHCEYLYRIDYVQVNHIEPILGKHSQWGCWHHSDNLEVLCKDCHHLATQKQREDGLI